MKLSKIFKNFVPRSLYARFLTIIILPTVVVQLVAVYIFYDRHWTSMTRNLSASLSGEISMVIQSYNMTEDEKKQKMLNLLENNLDLSTSFIESESLPEGTPKLEKKFEFFSGALERRLHRPFSLEHLDESNFMLHVKSDGGIFTFIISEKRLANPTTYIFIMWMVGSAAILLVVSILFLRGQVRSVIRLTKAAEKFGRGLDEPNFKPQGAKEVRQAAISFIQMRERIKRLLERRTQMLAGVSHDLRTPLTRMRLQLSMMNKSNETLSMLQDIEEMEKMLQGYLDFARNKSQEENHEAPLGLFFDNIMGDYQNHQGTITCNINATSILRGRLQNLKRAFCNIINNALQYGKRLNIRIHEYDGYLNVIFDDDGPGIAEGKYEEVFQPFVRLETSRNQETGGIGLGLSVARDIIHSHGGTIELYKSDMGGLRVIVRLPV